jgi:hypothetical protein
MHERRNGNTKYTEQNAILSQRQSRACWCCTKVQKVCEYRKIFGNASAAKFRFSEDLANTFGLKLLHFRNYCNYCKSGKLQAHPVRFPVCRMDQDVVKLVWKSVAIMQWGES